MKIFDYDHETVRLAEEADVGVILHGPADHISMLLYGDCEEYSPWIYESDNVFNERLDARKRRFDCTDLDSCDPSYNIDRNYDPPANIFLCVRYTDTIDGDWYEYHNCPKYKNVQRRGYL